MLQIRNFKSWNFMAKKSLHLINYTAFVIQLTINQMLIDCNGTRSHNHLVRKRSTAWKVSKYGVFSGPYFPVFGLNKERYSVSLRIQSECGKKTDWKKTPNLTLFTQRNAQPYRQTGLLFVYELIGCGS